MHTTDKAKYEQYKKEFERLKEAMSCYDWPQWYDDIYELVENLLKDYERLADETYSAWENELGEDL